jgi:hypothetical protein
MERRSRRQMLVGGIAAAAAVAVGRVAGPDRASAANGDPLLAGAANTATDPTKLTSTDPSDVAALVVEGSGASAGLRVSSAAGTAVHAFVGNPALAGTVTAPHAIHASVIGNVPNAVGVQASVEAGVGAVGYSTGGTGVAGSAQNQVGAGVAGFVGSGIELNTFDAIEAGVFGLGGGGTSTTAGVWGHTVTGVGVYGSGPWGVYGTGAVGVTGDVAPGGTGVYGFVGTTTPPIPTGSVAVEARVASTSHLALNVVGRAKFSRSGRILIGAGKSSIVISLTGVSASSLVFANLYTYRSGTWVISATPTTNTITIRLNKTLTSSAYVVWFVLN